MARFIFKGLAKEGSRALDNSIVVYTKRWPPEPEDETEEAIDDEPETDE